MINPLLKTRDPEITRISESLAYARGKLLEKEIPAQLRAISYLRISCSSFQKLRELGADGMSTQLRNVQFSLLLKSLTEYDARWWDRCIVSRRGVLKSEDSVIEHLLEPLSKIHFNYCAE
jgi:hypothetical protein